MAEATQTPSADATVPSATNPVPAEKPDVAPQAEAKPAEKTEAKADPAAGKSLVSGKEETTEEATETKAEEKSAEDIQLKLPEGVKVDEKLVGDFKNVAKELGLKSEGAQKLMDLHLDYVNRLEKEFREVVTKQADEWYEAIKVDPDVGGSKLKETAASIQRAVQKFGDKDFKQAVDEMGLGNWPPLVKLLTRIGASLKDDTSTTEAKPASTPANDDDAFARALYPNTPQMFKS